jgi:hypothetical protein
MEARNAAVERERVLALAAVLVTVTLWASAFVGIRAASQQLSPEALALGRLTIASIALGLIVLARREPLPARRDLPAIAFVGVFWFALYNIALMEGERRVDAGTAAMLVNVGPILIPLLAGVFLREGFPPRLLAGCAVAFVGALVIGAATSKHGFAPSGASGSVWPRHSSMPLRSSPKSRCSRASQRFKLRGSPLPLARSSAYRLPGCCLPSSPTRGRMYSAGWRTWRSGRWRSAS